jgi:5S rRNA maturation endonuclease (ribonuclease M5)
VLCNQCFNENNGDFIAAVQWMHDVSFQEALSLVAEYLGVSPVQKDKPVGNGQFDRKNIAAEYPYTDAGGNVVYKVIRDVHKNFMQCRPDSKNPGQWIWNLNGVERVPYQLPLLLDESRHTLYIVEGEKDTDNLNRLFLQRGSGYVATTSAGGVNSAKQWPGFISKYGLAGKRVVVMPDNDQPGLSFGRNVCKVFVDAGCENIKMVLLPKMSNDDSPIKDVSDLIELRRGEGKQPQEIFDELMVLCKQSERVTDETVAL